MLKSRSSSSVPPLAALLIAFALLMGMCACSSDGQAVALDLLATVPADADGAGVVKISDIADHSEFLSHFRIPEGCAPFFSPEAVADAGIEPTAAVFFQRGSKLYVTGRLKDRDAFMKRIMKAFGEMTTKEGKAIVCRKKTGEWVMAFDDQFWYVSKGTPDYQELADYMKQPEQKSFVSHRGLTESITSMETAVAAVSNIQSLVEASGLGIRQSAPLLMGVQTVFKGAEWVKLTASISKSKADIEMIFTDGDASPVPMTFRLSKIDTGMVEKLNASAPVFFAIGMPSATMKLIDSQLGNILPSQALTTIDGTLAVAASSQKAFKGSVATDGTDLNALSSLLSSALGASPAIDGHNINFSAGTLLPGKITSKEAASRFKDAYAGICFASEGSSFGSKAGFGYATLLLKPHKNTCALSLSIEFPKDTRR